MSEIKVLDHGYVRYVDAFGSDSAIIEAARMSTSKGFLGWDPEYAFKCTKCEYRFVSDRKALAFKLCPADNAHGELVEDKARSHPGDAKLLAHLWRNRHLTPFEMGGLVIEVKAPLFVFREWHRHRTQSYNEMSARYIPLPDEHYIPDVDDVIARSGANANKQASSAKTLELSDALAWIGMVSASNMAAQIAYEFGLKAGVPKELARITTPVARYSKMRASANLRNWLHFLSLRDAPLAQKEIRLFAEAVGALVAQRFPRTYALFKEKPTWVGCGECASNFLCYDGGAKCCRLPKP